MTTRVAARISVVIPVFNGAKTLPVCLEAVSNSRYPAAECWVIDDGSTDGSASLAERMGALRVGRGTDAGTDTGTDAGPDDTSEELS